MHSEQEQALTARLLAWVVVTIKLVASDLDGTLFRSDAVLSSRTVDALQAVAAAGIEVVAVTGRSHRSSTERLRPAGCIRWIICSNGATLFDFDAEAVVHDRPLAEGVVAEVLDRVQRAFPSVGLSWETEGGVFMSEQWISNRAASDPRYRPRPDRETRELAADAGPILKLMLAHESLTTYDWLEAVRPHLPPGLSVSTSGASFVEITRGDANKGEALRQLCSDLAIGQHETMAFGDHANDVPMLSWAGTSYAMANADIRVQAVADHTAPHHDQDGVAQVLERLDHGSTR